ncbi:ATP-dependent RNA helicase SrmB [Corallincola spongiicola]|uniref:ATP-dependent RNA helicase SrmB n=1 Tax=Corallincola spongiicola TaxID=2520508 RepID=A0ABY1WRF4_9GAMM|nr:ATP-dependent RNA helicase SrmB [Corallincola spongiicola]TAA47317.1 ATP-dependent RNA helicase SrmB [Corallincola spongiicola]
MTPDFESLDIAPELIRALAELGHSRPTTVQQEMIPFALDDRDVMASAPTGTGKTAAFLLPALQHLIDFPRRKPGPPRILVLVPTRELAQQVLDYAITLTQFTELKCASITGGVEYEKHVGTLHGSCDLVVATPGRLMEYINSEVFDCRAVECLILDEADRMLDMGFIAEMDRIADETRWRKQTLLLSATLEGKGLEKFARDVLKEPALVHSEPPRREANKIVQWVHLADNLKHKQALLASILTNEETQRAIVFVKTRDRLMELSAALDNANIVHSWIRGEMAQDRRNEALQKFRDGDTHILLATDVAARGLDIPEISHVINYDLPRTADIYVHRIGRTARAGRKGIAVSLIEAHDMANLSRIERYTEQQLKRRTIKGLAPQNREARLPGKGKGKAGKKKLTAVQAKRKAKKQLKRAVKKSAAKNSAAKTTDS